MENSVWSGNGEYSNGEFLYREFCNHVYLGQWELARAFALTISRCENVEKSYKDKIKETLKTLAGNPHVVRNSWLKFSSPSCVSYLSSQLFQQISGTEKQDVDKLHQVTSFNVMLEECFPKLSQTQLQELSWLFSMTVDNVLECQDTRNQFGQLSEKTNEFIYLNLVQSPSVISLLLQDLTRYHSKSDTFAKWRTDIFKFVLSSLRQQLKVLESVKCDTSENIELLPKCYLLLGLLPSFFSHGQIGLLSKQLDSILLTIDNLCRKDTLQVDKVYRSLLSNGSTELLDYLCEKENQFLHQVSDYPSVFYDGKLDLHESALCSLRTKSHFLGCILDFCAKRVVSGDFNFIQNLLSNSIFSRLLPLILILSWSACKDDFAFSNVVQATKSWIPSAKDDNTLVEICNNFLTNVTFKDNCIEYYQTHHPDAESKDIMAISNTIFNQLQTQSPLFVLQQVFMLRRIESCVVVKLLDCFSKDSSECNSKALIASRDTIIYHSYLSITLVMEAILYSCEIIQYNYKNDMQPLHKTEDVVSSDAPCASSSVFKDDSLQWTVREYIQNHGLEETYKTFVSDRIMKVRQELRSLHSVTYRLEILENIFSLLFVSSKDLRESPFDYSASDEGHEGEEKYSSSSLKDTSINSEKDCTYAKDSFVLRDVETLVKDQSLNIRNIDNGEVPCVSAKLKSDISDLQSGHGSSRSTGSSGSSGISTSGFLCNELIISDLLLLLKDAILEVSAEIYKARSGFQSNEDDKFLQDESQTTKLPFLNLKLSINADDVQKRLSQLRQYVEEAYWRYNLVKSDSLKAVPSVQMTRKDVSSSSSSNKKNYISGPYCRMTSSDNADSSEGSGQKRKKKKKHKQLQKQCFQRKGPLVGSGIIHRMLSSPNALLRYCLWKQNTVEALEVIKLCKLQSALEAKELMFSMQVDHLYEKVLKASKSQEKFIKRNSTKIESKSTMSDILAIANAAASGLHSTSLSSIIDQEINKWDIPQISEVVEIKECVTSAEKSLLNGAENLSSIALGDIAYTREFTLEQCAMLLEMALAHWTHPAVGNTMSVQKKSFSFIPGCCKMLQSTLDLLKIFQAFFCRVGESDKKVKSLFFCNSGNSSAPEILVNYLGPLTHSVFSNQSEVWTLFFNHLSEVEKLLKIDIFDNCVNPKNPLHLVFKSLFQVMKNLSGCSSEVIRPHPQKYRNFLKKLFVYLQQVASALLGCKDQNVPSGLTSYTSYFSVLKESPPTILRNMIDQNKISLKKIEKFAIGMKVDLSQVLVQTLFPSVPLSLENRCNKYYPQDIVNPSSGCPSIVLNISNEIWLSPRHPDVTARELLRDVISMAQDVAMAKDSGSIHTTSALLSLSRHSELSSWMSECSELANVNLDLLQTPEELKAFFINVTNLAWIHALLLQTSLWNSEESPEPARHYVYENETSSKKSKFNLPPLVSESLVQRVLQQKNLGYAIGQLGVVSLFDLRYNILHSNFPIPKHLNVPPFNKLFLHDHDIPSIWTKYAPKADPREVFVLCEGLLYSPKIQVLYSETISEQLDDAMKEYLNFNISVNVQEKQVTLPELLDLYSLDFDDGRDTSNSPYEGLLNFLTDFMGPQLSKPLEQLLSLNPLYSSTTNTDTQKKQMPFEVDIKPLSMQPGLKLDYVLSDAFDSLACLPSCPISPETTILSHLKDTCPIIAYIYGLMVNEDVIDVSKYPITYHLDQKWKTSCKTSTVTKSKNLAELGWFTSALCPAPSVDFTLQEIQKCFNAKQWITALSYIDSVTEVQEADPGFPLLRQMVLETMAGEEPNSGNCPWSWAISISDPAAKIRTVLQHVQKWDRHSAISALQHCLSDEGDHPLKEQLRTKLKEITIYQKVLDASMNLGSELSEAFANWQDIAEKSVWDQSSIINCIKNNGDYQLAVEWAELHVVNSPLKQVVWSMELLWYMKQEQPLFPEALNILESCSSTSECIELIEQVLPEVTSVKCKLFLVEFVAALCLEYTDQRHYQNMVLGLKMLDASGIIEKSHYYHLIQSPHLLLEQLLMNLEVNAAEKALEAVCNDLNNETYMGVSLSPRSVNHLLENYASKALELPIADDLSESNTTILDSEEISFTLEQFVMPFEIPTKEQWIPDSRIHICQCCKQEQFNMFSRRHHCRRCGRVICADCSQNTLVLENFGKYGVRACDDCYNQTMCSTISGRMTPPRSLSLDKRYRMLSSMKLSGQRSSPLVADYYIVKRRASSIANSDVGYWILSENEEENYNLRIEFFYDSAPSVSLALSLLKLHSNIGQCATFMLTLCDRLISKLRPKSSGKTNSEVDFYLVIGMIRTFLVNAKVKYHQILDHESEATIDAYFERLEIIKMLINAHCTHLIPKDDILSNEIIRKLRDCALEEERMSLALEISTYFGLDKVGVWASWGLFCLRAGDWMAAREKFKQCLKVVKDRSKRARESPTLHTVISYLEKCHYSGHGKAAAIYKTLSFRDQILKGKTKVVPEMLAIDSHVKEECLYYLCTYGSHFTTVAFYQRQGLMSEALTYITREKCEQETFVEALFMPALKCSQLPALLQHMNLSDPSLMKWWSYLLSCCRYLHRISYHNVLYQLQIFMGDFVRAAKSSIAFYLAPTSSYKTMYFERNHHLLNAKKHFEMFLSKSRSVSSQNKNILALPEKEIYSYIRTVLLQQKLANFFESCDPEDLKPLENTSETVTGKNTESGNITTLFSSWSKKSELASLVLLNAIKVDEGFDLAMSLIKEYRLAPLTVACSTGREIIRLQWLEHLPHFIQNITCYFPDNIDVDDIILECISALQKQGGDLDFLIKMLTSDVKKINAYLLCSKLKNAYLLAIKLQRAQDVRRIMKAADQTGQEAVKRICEKWLFANAEKL